MELVPFWRRWTGTDSFLKWTFHTLLILGTCCGVLPKEVGHHCKIVYFTRTMCLLSPLSSTHPKVWTSSVAVSKGQSHFMEFPYSVPASVACLLFHSQTAKDCFVLYNPIYSRLMSQSIDSSYAWIPPNLLGSWPNPVQNCWALEMGKVLLHLGLTCIWLATVRAGYWATWAFGLILQGISYVITLKALNGLGPGYLLSYVTLCVVQHLRPFSIFPWWLKHGRCPWGLGTSRS